MLSFPKVLEGGDYVDSGWVYVSINKKINTIDVNTFSKTK